MMGWLLVAALTLGSMSLLVKSWKIHLDTAPVESEEES